MSAKVPTARLGKNGPQVSRLGYGAMGLSSKAPLIPYFRLDAH